MGTSHYFNFHSPKYKTNEQRLYEDVIVESIKIMGHDIFYMPRESWDTTDQIFGENIQSKLYDTDKTIDNNYNALDLKITNILTPKWKNS